MPQRPARVASTSPFPSGPLSFPMPQLSAGTRETLGLTVSQFIEGNQGLRPHYDRSLDGTEALYEMRT